LPETTTPEVRIATGSIVKEKTTMAAQKMKLSRETFSRIKRPPQIAYRLGLGRLIGRLVLLLTTTGRKSGLPRVTPLQYERVDGLIYVMSARGTKADWFRNILADPRVEVRIKNRRWRGIAEPITDPVRIADMLELRRARHPRLIGFLMHKDGLPVSPSREQLTAYAANLAMVVIRPDQEA
jgi:deazaflavin-dependent oxidoreductase (nitroreductase family)